MTENNDLCPCGSGKTYQACCEPLLSGERQAETAETLMRSRYTAYATRDSGYLLATWHEPTKPECLDLQGIQQPEWVSLDVLNISGGRAQDDEGRVEFVAHYRMDGARGQLHEKSRFQRIDGRWYYVDGEKP